MQDTVDTPRPPTRTEARLAHVSGCAARVFFCFGSWCVGVLWCIEAYCCVMRIDEQPSATCCVGWRQQCSWQVVWCFMQAAVSALSKAVRESVVGHPTTYPDECLAVLELLAAAKEGLYVRLLKHQHFVYRSDGLPHDTTNTAAAQHR